MSQTGETDDDSKRVKKLTERAREAYDERIEQYQTKLISYRKELEETVILFKNTDNLTKNQTIDLKEKLNSCFEVYEGVMEEVSEYLKRVYTEKSLSELKTQEVIHRTVAEQVVNTLHDMEIKIKNVTQTVKAQSNHSVKAPSRHSSVLSSKSAVLIANQKAKLEAAKTRLEFEKKEAALKEKKANLDAQMDILVKEKDVAVETVVLETLEEELDQRSQVSSVCSEEKVINTKTFQYVQTPKPDLPKREPLFDNSSIFSGLNPTAKTFKPDEQKQYSDLSSYLLKRDLLIKRFYHYDDKPETFNVWKTSFRSIVSDLNATPAEEFDLLSKYLGPESKFHARAIRQANSNNLKHGIELVWERLHERFGSPELVERSLKQRLEKFPRITKDNSELYKLSDLCNEIESVKSDPRYGPLLSYFDSSTGVKPITEKLPIHLQNRWMTRASQYKKANKVYFPPFSEFCSFLKEMSVMLNDPGLCVFSASKNDSQIALRQNYKPRTSVNVSKTVTEVFVVDCCPVHGNTKSHSLNDCKTFKGKSVTERKRYLKDKNICYKCLNSNSHTYKECSFSGRCMECGSERHPTGLHFFGTSRDGDSRTKSTRDHGREQFASVSPHFPSPATNNADLLQPQHVINSCTNICGNSLSSKSCSKTVLVKVHPEEHPEQSKLIYCIIDDQSNRTLGKTELFQMWNTDTLTEGSEEYDMISCSGKSACRGRTLSGLCIQSVDDSFSLTLPSVLECDSIPASRSEIPVPEISQYHSHLCDIPINPLQPDVNILLLIGRDVPEAHHVYDQRIARGQPNAPFAQKLGLGWVIIGEVCLGSHKPGVKCMKTYVNNNGRPSLFEPCMNKITVKNRYVNEVEVDDIFVQTRNDDKPGLSIEDKDFLILMDNEFRKDETGHWTAPLPFRSPRAELPNNRAEAYRRAKTFESSLKKDQEKLKHSLDFMANLIDKGYCERAPPLKDEECWYLPLFGVYHPKKRDKIRLVFDSSSKFNGVSLNNVLMSGPDLTNSLTGILMRFRKEQIAIMGDIEQMFYQFRVNREHRNYLRFLWYADNNFENPLVEYRMCVHVFGNAPSPAVAAYGLRKTAGNAAQESTVINFVENDFYVDDGLTSVPTVSEAVELIRNTQHVLQEEGNLRFHKLSSNSVEVLKCFPDEDLSKDLKHFQISEDSLPVQRSLGLCWDLNEDCFMFQTPKIKTNFKYTKRSVLSTINSLFDPLGFLSPFTITGKLLLRDIVSEMKDWDEPLQEHLAVKWQIWTESLQELVSLQIPRVYLPDMKFDHDSKLHIFCDASEKAIASVAYLVVETTDSQKHVANVFGKTKVAPKHGHTIPRLELCAAVLGIEIAETVSRELSIPPENITYHSDSKVVLGYLTNKTRRFFVYVENRVSRILNFSKSTQWRYVETSINPADEGTRGMKMSDLANSSWLSGNPMSFIQNTSNDQYDLQFPQEDAEVCDSIKSMKTEIKLGTDKFEKFSSWKRLLLAFSTLIHFIRQKNDKSVGNLKTSEMSKDRAKEFVIKRVQSEAFSREVQCLKENKNLPKDSHVLNLSPFLDENGILRVGGRLKNSQLGKQEKHPILIPGKSHIALLIIRHYHEEIHHQGRHITEGAVRAAGFWLTGGKRRITNHIFNCVTCRKLRGQFSKTKMADLPTDRITPAPPFTFVGVDVFGPWNVVTRRTRGGSALSKRWAVLFTCLTVRAIHIEVIDEMSSSAFINALRRFISIRGNVKIFRSDRGTNFIGATDDLDIQAINVEDKKVKNFLYDSGSTWLFNPPHASHMGGVWERMIGLTRRILDAILLENKHKQLTHDVLSTFMAEVCAIVNSRPITAVSTDPEDPLVLTPSVLLTQITADSVVNTFQHLDVKDMYRAQWKCVQVLAEVFWKRWRSQYLVQLQSRKIWQNQSENVNEGDFVLLRDKSVARNDWPVGLVTKVYPSEDGVVRKCSVKVMKDGKATEYVRPVVELVKLLE